MGLKPIRFEQETWVDTRTIENRVGAALMMRIILPSIEIGKPAPGSRRLSPWQRPARKRDSGERTMGSGFTNSTSTISKSRIRPKIKLSLQVLCPL